MPYLPKLCIHYNAGGTCYDGKACRYTHDLSFRLAACDTINHYKSNTKAPHPKLCHKFVTGFNCINGDKCQFIHDNELRARAQAVSIQAKKHNFSFAKSEPAAQINNKKENDPKNVSGQSTQATVTSIETAFQRVALQKSIPIPVTTQKPALQQTVHHQAPEVVRSASHPYVLDDTVKAIKHYKHLPNVALCQKSSRLHIPKPKCRSHSRRFELFQKFPKDIRLVIWDLAIARQLTITVRLYKSEDGTYKLRKRRKSDLMGVLQACRESRAQALLYYKPSIGPDPKTYFDYQIDILYLDTKNCTEVLRILDSLSPTDLDCIRNLQMKVVDWLETSETEMAKRFWRFRNLKKVKMLVGDQAHEEFWARFPKITAGNIKEDLYENKPAQLIMPKVACRVVKGMAMRRPTASAVSDGVETIKYFNGKKDRCWEEPAPF